MIPGSAHKWILSFVYCCYALMEPGLAYCDFPIVTFNSRRCPDLTSDPPWLCSCVNRAAAAVETANLWSAESLQPVTPVNLSCDKWMKCLKSEQPQIQTPAKRLGPQSGHYCDLCVCLFVCSCTHARAHVCMSVCAAANTPAFTFCSSKEPEYLTVRSRSWADKTDAHCCTL